MTDHTAAPNDDCPVPTSVLRLQEPGPDGIRWGLVNRMKELIAADKLDTPERWALAEEMLCRAAEGGD